MAAGSHYSYLIFPWSFVHLIEFCGVQHEKYFPSLSTCLPETGLELSQKSTPGTRIMWRKTAKFLLSPAFYPAREDRFGQAVSPASSS